MSAKRRLVLGLDLGGTKLAAGLVDLAATRLIDAAQTPTRRASGAAVTLVDMLDLVERLQAVDQITGVGVSFGGHVRDNQILRSLHVRGWSDFPLLEELRSRFAGCDVNIANDANAMAMGEWKFGAGRGASSLLYLTVSTGIGGGIILDGQLVEGHSGMAGEIGHTKVVPDGPLCTCGGHGCLEALAAGPAVVRHAQTLLRRSTRRGKSTARSQAACPQRSSRTAPTRAMNWRHRRSELGVHEGIWGAVALL